MMILEILWCLIFTLLVNLLAVVKMGRVPFLPQVSRFYTNRGVKIAHL